MKSCASLILAILIAFTAQAQWKIQSTITDSVSSKPVAYATIALYKKDNNQKPVQQVISKEDGSFTLTIKDTASYEVSIVHSNYKELLLPATKDFPTQLQLTVAEHTMSNVQVTAVKKTLIEKSDDKLVYNVESDVTLDGQTATDALRKTPFISVDGDGNIQLKGQSNFKILLNGKESGMFSKDPKEALKSFPASSIKKIEVITSPSAKYDAEGVAGIINIITNKKVVGYNGSVGVNYNTIGNGNVNASLNAKYGKLGFTGYFGAGKGRNNPTDSYSEIISLNPVAYSKRILQGTRSNKWQWVYSTLELSYDIDSLNTISGYLNIGGNNGANVFNRVSDIINPSYTDTTRSKFNNNVGYRYPWHDMGIDYIMKFKGKPEQEWSFKFNQEFSRDYDTSNSTLYDISDYKYTINDNRNQNRQLTFQTDFTLPLPNKQKLELGAKAVLRDAWANYVSMYRMQPDGKFTDDVQNTDKMNYAQHVWAAYATYRFSIKKWSARIGARVEETTVNGTFKTSDEQIKNKYTNLVPSVYISKKIGEKHDLSFSYSKRLRRPYIWDLNPFVTNIDTLNVSSGNPYLSPEITHTFEIGYSYFKGSTNLNIKLSENYCGNQMIRYTSFNDATGVAYTRPENVGENLFTALNISASLKIFKIWSMNLNSGVQYNYIKNKMDPAQINKGFSGNANVNNTFDITKKITLFNSGGFWQSPIQLQGRYPFNYWYDAGVTYKLMDNKLRLTVRAANFFSQYRTYTSKFADANFMQTTSSTFPFRSIGISLKWNFGKLTENTSRKRGVSNDDIKK
ncbi:MAG: TonB-dependent receptor [Filimonas sp.]|nr:TonB-dependent receptor [Filimonas sp.]